VIKMLVAMACLLGAATLALAADSQTSSDGRKAETTSCVACHSTRLIDSQRLSAATWAKEVDKMIGWGAIVTNRQLLVDYLASEYSDSKPVPTPATSGNGVTH
jgi:mono/diheme cytochrome c family protein